MPWRPGVSPVAATPAMWPARSASAVSWRDTSIGRASAAQERGEHADRGPLTGREVDERDADTHRRPIRLTGDAHDPGRRLHERVVAGTAGIGADRDVDEGRVARTKRVGAETEPLGEPGAEALHEHVCGVDELEHALDLVREVDDDRSLAGVRGEPERAVVADERRSPRSCVITFWRLDLDDLRSERREQLRAIRPGERRRDVDDELSVERLEAQCARARRAASILRSPRRRARTSRRASRRRATSARSRAG